MWKSAAAIVLSTLAAAATPCSAQVEENNYGPTPYVNNSYGPPPGYADGYAKVPVDDCDPENYSSDQGMPLECQPQIYCDQYGCPDDFYDMPIWYGPVFYNNVWFGGPVYYRDWYGRRQYWIQGGWHYDTWQGPRPNWWNASLYHIGPALGRNHYKNHGGGNVTNGVRVWRGTQGSAYYDKRGVQFWRPGFAYRQNMPQVTFSRGAGQFSGNPRPIGGNFQVPHVPQQINPQHPDSRSHNSSSASTRGFRGSGGGYHGRKH